MTSDNLEQTLITHLNETAALESGVERMLEDMVERAPTGALHDRLEHHLVETRQQRERIESCLESHGASPSGARQALASAGAGLKNMFDSMRGEQAGRDGRDGYVTEHVEIAAYELLERVAIAAGDPATAAVARRNCAEERDMAAFFETQWDVIARRSLQEAVA